MTKQKLREAFGCFLLFLAYDFLWVGLRRRCCCRERTTKLLSLSARRVL